MDGRFSAAEALFNQGKFSESASILAQILVSNSNSINTLSLLARCMLQSYKIDNAIQLLEKILRIEPHNHEAKNIILAMLVILRNTDKAKEYCEKIVAIKGDCAEVLILLAEIACREADIEKSIHLLNEAAQIAPLNHTIWYRLAEYFVKCGRFVEASNCSNKALKLNNNLAEYHNQSGRIHYLKRDMYSASNSFKRALAINPANIETKLWLDRSYSSVPAWHIPMMNDLHRNNAYLKAINKAIKSDMLVLEIGTGSGLLSMMAVDAGANKVITCEVDKIIAEAAKQIISQNGYSKKISVLGKKSTELTIGSDIPQRVDLVLSEILSSEFVGEGVIPTIVDASRRLMKNGCKMIPEGGEILVTLLSESAKAKEDNLINNQFGYNLSDFNKMLQSKKLNILKEKPTFKCSIEVPFSFDFYKTETLVEKEKIFEIEVLEDCTVLGIITWLKLNLYDNIVFENKPSESGSGWINPIYCFEEPLSVTAGQKIRVKGILMSDNVWFEVMDVCE